MENAGRTVVVTENIVNNMLVAGDHQIRSFAERLLDAVLAFASKPTPQREHLAIEPAPSNQVVVYNSLNSRVHIGAHVCDPAKCVYQPLIEVATPETCAGHEANLRDAGILKGNSDSDPAPQDIWICTAGGVYHDCRQETCKDVQYNRSGFFVCWKSCQTLGQMCVAGEHCDTMTNVAAQLQDERRAQAFVLGREGLAGPTSGSSFSFTSNSIEESATDSTGGGGSVQQDVDLSKYYILSRSWLKPWNASGPSTNKLVTSASATSLDDDNLSLRRNVMMQQAEDWRMNLLRILGKPMSPDDPRFVTDEMMSNAESITRMALFDVPNELMRESHQMVIEQSEPHKLRVISQYAILVVRAWILVDVARNVKSATNILRLELRRLTAAASDPSPAGAAAAAAATGSSATSGDGAGAGDDLVSLPPTTSSEERYLGQIWKKHAIKRQRGDGSFSAKPAALASSTETTRGRRGHRANKSSSFADVDNQEDEDGDQERSPMPQRSLKPLKTHELRVTRLTKYKQIGFGMLYTASTGYDALADLRELGIPPHVTATVYRRLGSELGIEQFSRSHAMLFVSKDAYLSTKLQPAYSKKNCMKSDRRSSTGKVRIEVGVINNGSTAVRGCLAALVDWSKMWFVYQVVVMKKDLAKAVQDFDNRAFLFKMNA